VDGRDEALRAIHRYLAELVPYRQHAPSPGAVVAQAGGDRPLPPPSRGAAGCDSSTS
jgi:hypothetical protein